MPLRLALSAMATRFELVLEGAGSEAQLRAAGEEALERIREEEQRLSAFRRDSLVARVNAAAGGAPVRVDDEFLDLLELCRSVHAASCGAFDPALGAQMAALGFRGAAAAPGRTDGGAGAPAADFGSMRLDRACRTVALPAGLQLDLGGVGKGWAIDQALEVLRAAGVRCALLHGGSSTVAALGAPPDAAAWQIALRDPHSAADAVLETIPLKDCAFSVSAPHGRTIESAQGSHSHLLDPRTGEPASGTAMAAVVAGSAALADAWSTALAVRGNAPAAAPLDWFCILPAAAARPAGAPTSGSPATLP